MKTKLLVKLVLLFGIVILASGCAHRPYRQDLPTKYQEKHTEIITHPDGTRTVKETVDEGYKYEPVEKYERQHYRGRRYYNDGYYGRSAIRVCIIGCGDGNRGHHGHHH